MIHLILHELHVKWHLYTGCTVQVCCQQPPKPFTVSRWCLIHQLDEVYCQQPPKPFTVSRWCLIHQLDEVYCQQPPKPFTVSRWCLIHQLDEHVEGRLNAKLFQHQLKYVWSRVQSALFVPGQYWNRNEVYQISHFHQKPSMWVCT